MLLQGGLLETLAEGIALATALFPQAAGSEMKMILFKNNIVPTPETVLADLTQPTFDGYAAVTCGAGAVQSALDPISGQWQIRPLEPAGGFQYMTDSPVDPSETIYGYALTNNAVTSLIASQLFPEPITLTAENQVIDVPQPTLKLAFNPLT